MKTPLLCLCLLAWSLAVAHAQQSYSDGQDNSSTLTNTGSLTLTIDSGTATQSGSISGSGNVIKSGGGTLNLTANNSYSGSTTVQEGTLTVLGPGVINQPGATLTVSGYAPSLIVQDGGQISALSMTMGNTPAYTAQATVKGVGGGQASTLSLNGVLRVGGPGINSGPVPYWGGGSLAIQDGGQVTNLGTTTVGDFAGSESAITVSGINANGTASTLNVQSLSIGVGNEFSSATLTVLDGAQVSSTFTIIGQSRTNIDSLGRSYSAGGRGTVLVSGVNANGTASTWTNVGSLVVNSGVANTPTLTVADGGNVITGALTVITKQTVNLNSGGVLKTGSITNSGGTINFDGGIARASGDSGSFFIQGSLSGSKYVLASGGGTIDNAGHAIAFAVGTGGTAGTAGISGSGALSYTGAGTTTVAGTNTYTGGTTVKTTVVVNSNSALGTGSVNVTGGGTLQINAGFHPTNPLTLTDGSLTQTYASGTVLSTLTPYKGQSITGQFLDGVTSADATITAGFHLNSTASNDGYRYSPVFSLSDLPVVDGLTGQTDLFVLQFQVIDLRSNSNIDWLNPLTNKWENAVNGNFGGTPNIILGAYNPATNFVLGNYGFDTSNRTVWAVLNHNSEFAVVPEPSTCTLLGFSLFAVFCSRRRRTIGTDNHHRQGVAV